MKYLNPCHLSASGQAVHRWSNGFRRRTVGVLIWWHRIWRTGGQAHTACAGRLDMDDAVAAARTAFDAGPWPRLLARGSGMLYLQKLQAELARSAEDLTNALVLADRHTAVPVPR
jgi:hypothetical protein